VNSISPSESPLQVGGVTFMLIGIRLASGAIQIFSSKLSRGFALSELSGLAPNNRVPKHINAHNAMLNRFKNIFIV
jgi:hypothetical protein